MPHSLSRFTVVLSILFISACLKDKPTELDYNYTSPAQSMMVLPPYKSITNGTVRVKVIFSESCLYKSDCNKANPLFYVGDFDPLNNGAGVSWKPSGDNIILFLSLHTPIEFSLEPIDTVRIGDETVIDVAVDNFRAEWYVNDTMVRRKSIGFDNELMWVSGPWMACDDHPRLEFMLNFL